MAEALKLQKMRMMMGFHSNSNQQRHHNGAELDMENEDTGVTSSPGQPSRAGLRAVGGVWFLRQKCCLEIHLSPCFLSPSSLIIFSLLTSSALLSTPCRISLSPVGDNEGSWEKEQHLLPVPSSAVTPPAGAACLNLNTLQQHSSLLANRKLHVISVSLA